MVWVVETRRQGGYLANGTYINTFEHELVGVFTTKAAAKRWRRRGYTVREIQTDADVREEE